MGWIVLQLVFEYSTYVSVFQPVSKETDPTANWSWNDVVSILQPAIKADQISYVNSYLFLMEP